MRRVCAFLAAAGLALGLGFGLTAGGVARAQTGTEPSTPVSPAAAAAKAKAAANAASGATMTSTLPEHTVLSRQSLIVRGRRGLAAPLPGTQTESAAAKPRGLKLNAGPLQRTPGCQTGYTNVGGQPARAGELYTSLGQRACGGH